jgi:hypothetical protein
MLAKVSEAAERVATSVSRRAFLGKLGHGALVVTGVLGGLLAIPVSAEAGRTCLTDSDCNHNQACCGERCIKVPRCPSGLAWCFCGCRSVEACR